MSTVVLATPRKPWRPTFRQAIQELIGAIATVAITFAVVGYSPLKGKQYKESQSVREEVPLLQAVHQMR